ncbi:MAG: addiction module protein [Planctomycetota bacterium]
MPALLEKIEKEARGLSVADRERLAAHLVTGLDGAPLTDIDRAWIDEAERRFDAMAGGKVRGIPAREVFKKIRRELGCRK